MNTAEKFQQFLAEKKSEPIGLNGRVLLIDGLNTYLRAFSSAPTMDENGKHIGGITGFLLSIGAAIRTLKPSRVVVVFDGKGGSQRRRKLFPEYKNNRRSMTRLNRTYDFGTVEDEKKAMQWQLVLLVELLGYLPLTIIHPDNVEADDVLAYLAQTVEERGGDAIVLSTDKDFLQLVNDKTSVWSPTKKVMLKSSQVVETYGFHPNNFLIYRAITGDKSDNIPGVDGIKEKTLLKFFPELAEEEKRDINYIFETVEKKIAEIKKPPVALKTLSQSRELIERNLELMRLDDVAMSGTTRIGVLEKFDAPINELNKYQLTKTVQSAKLMGAFNRWDEWLMNSFFPLLRFRSSQE
jgi:DNA polymerase-1